MTPGQAEPRSRAVNLLLPATPPRAFAVYAFRAHPTAGPQPVSAIPAALAASGIGVIATDLGPSADTGPATEDEDAAAVRAAADSLDVSHRAPALLIGHSAAGPAVLAAASSMTDVRAVVTVGSPAP